MPDCGNRILCNNILDAATAKLLHFGATASCVIPSFIRRAFVDMHVPSSARRCVVFIGEMSQGKFIPRATGFLVVTGERDRAYHVPYLVTAEHVISGMAHADKEIFVRVNLKNGTARVESAHNAVWSYHPTAWERTDVAVTSIAFDWDVVDHECIPLLTYDPVDDLPLMKPERQFGLGDETFTVGLFRSHYGAQRNMPISLSS